jgi:membrane-associated HD superfamily phosphohydrolase
VENKEKYIKLYLLVIVPLGVCAALWAAINLPIEKINSGLIALSVVTIFFSSYLKIQLPRTKIHLTVSDALIILSLLIYGGEIAVLLAALESLFTSLNFRRQGTYIKNRTILLNVAVVAVSTFVTAQVMQLVFSSPASALEPGKSAEFVILLTTMAFSQFIVNSICAATFIALKSDKTIWQVWNEYCLNALVMYLVGALSGWFECQGSGGS